MTDPDPAGALDGTSDVPTVLWLLLSEGMLWSDLDVLADVARDRVEFTDRGDRGVSWLRRWDPTGPPAYATDPAGRLVRLGLVVKIGMPGNRRGRGGITSTGRDTLIVWRGWRLARSRVPA